VNVRKVVRRVLVSAGLFGGCVFNGLTTAAPVPVTSVVKDATGVTFAMSPGSMRIDVCTDGIIRVRYSSQTTMPTDNNMSFLIVKEWAPVAFTQTETEADVSIVTSKMQVKVNKSTGAVAFLDASGTTVLKEAETGGKSIKPATINGESTNTCEQIFDSPADEGIYGLGSMHGGFINLHGMPEYLCQQNTHISIPMIISSKGYGILWANASRTYFNLPDQLISGGSFTTTTAGEYVFLAVDGPLTGEFSLKVDGTVVNVLNGRWHAGSISGKTTLGANKTVTVSGLGTLYGGLLQNSTKFTSRAGQTVDYYFFFGPTPDEVIAGYRTATGAASLFSKGTYGFIQCRERYNTQKDILENAYQFRTRKIPVDVIVQDWNYWTAWGSMEFDLTRYPNVKQMIDSLHTMNFKYMLSAWSNPQGGAVNDALVAQNLKITGTDFYDAYNPTARSVYWSNMNTKLFSAGMDAFWQDADEPENINLETKKINFGTGAIGAARYANAYPLFVCKTVYDGWRSTSSKKRVCTLTRSAFAGNQRFGTMHWNGDIGGNEGTLYNVSQSWDWYTRSITAGLNFCMTGIPYWTSDIGGFFRSPNQSTDAGYIEVLTRWIEYGAFCPLFRIHGYQSQTEMWRYGTEAETTFRKYDNLRYRLLPYIYSLAGHVTNNGYTMMRGLVMDFQNDQKVLNINDQFMFGPAFMVCPVTKAGATSRSVYLPGDTWYDFWSGVKVNGGTINAAAPKNQSPLYIKAGSIVPMGPLVQYAAERPADTIELRVYPGANGSFSLYEDEGDNYNYETGKYATIPITYIDNPRNVIVGARKGTFDGMDAQKIFNIVYVADNHGTGEGTTQTPDCQLVYKGEQVSCSPIVGVLPSTQLSTSRAPADYYAKVTGRMIAFPQAFSGIEKEVTVYSCSGRVLHTAIIKRNDVHLQKDMDLPLGIYIVKVRALR